MIYSLNGERCTSSSRALVQASIYKEFASESGRARQEDQGRPSARSGDRNRSAHPSASCCEGAFVYADARQTEGATIAAGGGRFARRKLCRADALYRREQRHEDRAGRDLRSGADHDPLRGRTGSARNRERRPLWPHRLHLDPGRQPRASRRARASKPAWSGSIPKTSAICRRRSAA